MLFKFCKYMFVFINNTFLLGCIEMKLSFLLYLFPTIKNRICVILRNTRDKKNSIKIIIIANEALWPS